MKEEEGRKDSRARLYSKGKLSYHNLTEFSEFGKVYTSSC